MDLDPNEPKPEPMPEPQTDFSGQPPQTTPATVQGGSAPEPRSGGGPVQQDGGTAGTGSQGCGGQGLTPPERLPTPQPKPYNPWLALLGVLYAAVLIASAAFMTRWPKLLPEAPRETVKKTSALKLLDFDYKSQAIGIVRLDGLIAMERRGSFFGETTIDRLEKNLERMAKKRHVKAIILRINSPGGTVASSQELYRSIRDLRQKYRKPVIALLGDVAASGGFYVASACDKIVAEPGTITGSIGVIFQSGHFDGLLRRYGIEFNTIKSGPYKDIGNPFRPMKPEEKEILQNLIDTAYSQFIMAVAEGRNMPPDKVKELADGRIWAGQQAAQIKMIDEDTGFKGAIELAKNLGKISGEPRLIWDGDLREDILESFLKGETGARFLGLIPATGITAVGALDYAKLPPSGLLYLWTGY